MRQIMLNGVPFDALDVRRDVDDRPPFPGGKPYYYLWIAGSETTLYLRTKERCAATMVPTAIKGEVSTLREASVQISWTGGSRYPGRARLYLPPDVPAPVKLLPAEELPDAPETTSYPQPTTAAVVAKAKTAELSRRELALRTKRSKAGRQKAKVKDPGDRAKIKKAFRKHRGRYGSDNATAQFVADTAGWMKQDDNHLKLKENYPHLKADDVRVIAGVKGVNRVKT
jgi:hypothetical protein